MDSAKAQICSNLHLTQGRSSHTGTSRILHLLNLLDRPWTLIRKDKTKLQNQVELDEGKDIRRDGSWFNSEGHKADMQALQKKIEEATMTEQAELLAELEEERHKTQAQMLKYKILTSLAPVA